MQSKPIVIPTVASGGHVRKGQLFVIISILVLALPVPRAGGFLRVGQEERIAGLVERDFASGQRLLSHTASWIYRQPRQHRQRLGVPRQLRAKAPHDRLVRFTVEVPVVYLPDQDLLSSNDLVPADYKALFVTRESASIFFPTRCSRVGSVGVARALYDVKNGVFNVLKVPARAPALVCSSLAWVWM